ncbi:hypothetical protein CASFOL_026277 [Castilleja foliolosa]|uniref:Uncharacterized protein n=1 Tax=Castilleja foliolosa TaxID=1961234 RepID=A0ABD3CMJ3_9LAMI
MGRRFMVSHSGCSSFKYDFRKSNIKSSGPNFICFSLCGTPTATLTPFSPSLGLIEKANSDLHGRKLKDGPLYVSNDDRTVPLSEAPNNDLGCTHLWLQSRVPLGYVPSQSTTTFKLEVLPLTDGIITLDSLQIEVREKGLIYIPEQSPKINATASIATGIF